MTRVEIYGSNVHSSVNQGYDGYERDDGQKRGYGVLSLLDSLPLYCYKVKLKLMILVLQSRGCEEILAHLFASTFGHEPVSSTY